MSRIGHNGKKPARKGFLTLIICFSFFTIISLTAFFSCYNNSTDSPLPAAPPLSGVETSPPPPEVIVQPGDLQAPQSHTPSPEAPIADPFPLLLPIPADPGAILSRLVSSWRDPRYEVFSWDRFPEILIYDTADYAVQDRLFKRLAFFVEKDGFRGHMAHDAEIAHLHGWNAHNYRAEDLALFFQTARDMNFPLHPEEWELEYILLMSGILRWSANSQIVPGRGAVLSISRESDRVNTTLRPRFMAHEGFHGLYFIDEDFRQFSYSRWNAFPDFAKTFLLAYFNIQAYDTTNEYLVVNEFMAHILQFSIANAPWYFGEHLPNIVYSNSAALRAYLPERTERTVEGRLFWPDLAAVFTTEAENFSEYVNNRWGLSAGRVWF